MCSIVLHLKMGLPDIRNGGLGCSWVGVTTMVITGGEDGWTVIEYMKFLGIQKGLM